MVVSEDLADLVVSVVLQHKCRILLSDGGYGGDGGFGGDGGGGGGGAGGNSYAVYVEGFTPDPLWVNADNDLDAGLPGLGGRGGRGGTRPNDGGNGVNGSNGDQW